MQKRRGILGKPPQIAGAGGIACLQIFTENEEIGAVVVAVTLEICEQALKLIKVDWEVFPTVVDPRDSLKPGSPFVSTSRA